MGKKLREKKEGDGENDRDYACLADSQRQIARHSAIESVAPDSFGISDGHFSFPFVKENNCADNHEGEDNKGNVGREIRRVIREKGVPQN